MPDFDTQNPREPSRPRKLLNSAAALPGRVANHPLVRLAAGLWSTMNRYRRRWAQALRRLSSPVREHGPHAVTGGCALLLAGFLVWSGVVYYPVYHPSRAQMPEFDIGFSNRECPAEKAAFEYVAAECYFAYTDAHDPELLALIAEELSGPYSGSAAVTRVEFFHSRDSGSPFATGYYFFGDKALARSVLTEGEISGATLWHGAYIFGGGFVPSRGALTRSASPAPAPEEMEEPPRGTPGGLGP